MPACTHENARPWISLNFDVKSDLETSFGNVWWCPNCNEGFVQNPPNQTEIQRHYDLNNYYTQASGSHMPTVPNRQLDRVLTKIAWMFDDPPADLGPWLRAIAPRIGLHLDIGSGNGGLLDTMHREGFEVCGLEPDQKARDSAAAKNMQSVEGTAEDMPVSITSSSFDLVTMTHVLEHCLSPETAIANARDCLTDDGVFYCEVPNAGATYFKRYAQISEMLDVPRHLHFFTKKSLQQLCDDAGLEVIEWRYHGYTRHHAPSWRAWENSIYTRLVARGEKPDCRQRSLLGSLRLILSTAWAAPEAKFDCIGFIARRAN